MCLCRALDPVPAIPFPVPVAHHCLGYGFAILVMPHFHHKHLHHSAPRHCPCPEDNAAAQEAREEPPSISSHFFVSFPCRIHAHNLLHRHLGGKISRLSTPAPQRFWTWSEGEFWLGVISGLPAWTRCVFLVCGWGWPQQARHGSKPKGFYTSLLTLQKRWWAPGALVIAHLTLDSSLQLLPWSFPWGKASLSPHEDDGDKLFFFFFLQAASSERKAISRVCLQTRFEEIPLSSSRRFHAHKRRMGNNKHNVSHFLRAASCWGFA